MGIKTEVTALIFSIGLGSLSIIYAWLKTRTKDAKIVLPKPRLTLWSDKSIHPKDRAVAFLFEFRNKGDIRVILYYTVTFELIKNQKPVLSMTLPEMKDGNVRFESMDLATKAIQPKGHSFSMTKHLDVNDCRVKVEGYYHDNEGEYQTFFREWDMKIKKTKLEKTKT